MAAAEQDRHVVLVTPSPKVVERVLQWGPKVVFRLALAKLLLRAFSRSTFCYTLLSGVGPGTLIRLCDCSCCFFPPLLKECASWKSRRPSSAGICKRTRRKINVKTVKIEIFKVKDFEFV